jgi:membrane protein implicated in regulation of membrane protease activity
MPAWIWLILSITMMILELLMPSGFFLFILGSAGLLLGLLVAIGVVSGWLVEVSVFCVFALAIWFLLGKRLPLLFSASGPSRGQLVGSVVVCLDEIAPGGHGNGELWGARWRLENIDQVPLAVGSEAVVVDSRGISLCVKRK